MERKKIFIAHGWLDVSLNIQTKQAAYKLSETADVWFFTQARIKQPELKVNDHLTVLEWPNKRPSKLEDLFFCIRQMRRNKPDTVIVHFGATKVVMLASWLTGVKNRIAWYHTLARQIEFESGNFFLAKYRLFVRTITYWFATKVVVQNEHAVIDAVKKQHISRHKIVKIANGLAVPVERKDDYSYNKEVLCFLYAGRLTKSKGCDFIIHTFARLLQKHKGVKLQMVGYGEDAEEFKRLIERLGAGEGIIMEGRAKTYNDMFGYYQNAYALVVPSKTDNFPTVIIEGMACGLPIVASNAGGIPDMVDDKKDGFLCGADDENDWVTKLEWLIENRKERDRMAACAREHFEAKYDISRHVQNVVNLVYGLDTAK